MDRTSKPTAPPTKDAPKAAADEMVAPATPWSLSSSERVAAEQPRARFARQQEERARIGSDLQRRAQPVQLKRAPGAPATAQSTERAVEQATSGAAGRLPHGDAIQRAFGRHDVSGVEAHVGESAGRGARQLGADAFATGNKTVFSGAPDLHTAAHEAAHVVQQRAGVQLGGPVGAVGDRYEQHADRVADLVVGGKSAEHVLDQMGSPSSGKPARGGVQRYSKKSDGKSEMYFTDNSAYKLDSLDGNGVIFANEKAPAPLWSEEASNKDGWKMYRPASKFYADCLHTAEEIMKGEVLKPGGDHSKVSETGTAFGAGASENWAAASAVHASKRDANAAPGVGQAYAITEEKERALTADVVCQYHAAAVVASDGTDRITLEVFGSPGKTKRTAQGTYWLYNTDPRSPRNFSTIWKQVFKNGVTISLSKSS